MQTIPTSWETKRALISDTVVEEEGVLYEIFNQCAYVGEWDEAFQPEGPEGLQELIRKSVEGVDLFRMQTIRLRESEEIAGYFHLRHNFPKPNTIWLSIFVLAPSHQRNGLGPEVMEALVKQIKALHDYRSIWLRVYLKNWPALQAWIKSGFTAIVEYRGDRLFSEQGYASLILERRVRSFEP